MRTNRVDDQAPRRLPAWDGAVRWAWPGRSRPGSAGARTVRRGGVVVRACPAAAAGREIWPAPGEAAGHIFQDSDLIRAWIATVGPVAGIAPWIVDVRDDQGTRLLLLALGIERRAGLRLLRFLDGGVMDYTLPLLFPAARDLSDATLAAIWAGLVRALPRFDVAVLDKMPAEVGGVPNPLIRLGAVPHAPDGYAMSLGGTAEDLAARLPRQRSRARHRRQLAQAADTVGLRVAETSAEADALLSALLDHKERQLRAMGRPGLRERPGVEAFYRRAAADLAPSGTVEVSALAADGAVIAACLCVVAPDRTTMLLTAYADGPWERFSPGGLLLDDLIRRSHARGAAWFDFGIGDEPYKRDYCDARIALHRAIIPGSLLGRVVCAGRALLRRRTDTP
ncbi:GNAT family N-acetyltransferase [Methylobacterium oryzisoli]|uniref:GNAT family N-acetyltransferase n=1 Tax=Methylobacterium oryzisoli TaxID=3385502 RepID=UPI003891F767